MFISLIHSMLRAMQVNMDKNSRNMDQIAGLNSEVPFN